MNILKPYGLNNGNDSKNISLQIPQNIRNFAHIYPAPFLWAGCDSKSIFKQSIAGLNSPRPVAIPSLPDYSPIADGRRDGFMSILSVLVKTSSAYIYNN